MSDNDLPSNLLDSIENIAKKEGYLRHEIETKLIPSDGANFCGKLYSVTIKGTTDKGAKENHIFVKCRIPGAVVESSLNLRKAYESEAYVYNELIKTFTELQDEAGISKEERFKTIKSYDESNVDALMLENMSLKGYTCCDRTYVASLEFAELSMIEIAKFHALIFVMEEKRPKLFEKVKEIKIPFIISEEWDLGGLNIAKLSARHIKGEARKKLDKFIDEKYLLKWKKYVTESSWVQRGSLCHGDFRLNNLLMKCTNNDINEVITVDYQLCHFGCPVEDILFLIFTGTDREFRTKHLVYLKELYYNTFSTFLKKFGLNSETVYSKKQFEDDYKEMLDYGLICSLFFCPFFLAKEGETPNIASEAPSGLDFNLHESFPDRIQGIVDDFVAWGYL